MKKKLQFKFSLLTRRQGFISLASGCSLIALITITWPAYSARWLESSDPKCKGPITAGGLACLCLEIKNSELPKELKDSETPIRYKWFRYIGTKPFFEETQKPPRQPLGEQSWKLCSFKDNIQAGLWQIDAVYENNEPVKCGNQDCHYSIRVE
jgi:hypothetical protein